jgi:hypothetical protein
LWFNIFFNIFENSQNPVERDVDSWVLNHWVLACIFDVANEREIVAQGRDFNGNSSATSANDSVYQFLNEMTREECFSFQTWEAFMCHPTAACVLHQQQQLCRVILNSNQGIGEQDMEKILVESSYYWARYITDLRMRTYFDITEQLGVQLHQQVDRPYEGGEEIWGLVGTLHTIHIDNVLAKLTKGERWSFYGTSPPRYLSGPVSLINHACHKHSNVIIKPIVEKRPSWLISGSRFQPVYVAIAETRISAGDRIYATYNRDESELRTTRGIECNVCLRYLK